MNGNSRAHNLITADHSPYKLNSMQDVHTPIALAIGMCCMEYVDMARRLQARTMKLLATRARFKIHITNEMLISSLLRFRN